MHPIRERFSLVLATLLLALVVPVPASARPTLVAAPVGAALPRPAMAPGLRAELAAGLQPTARAAVAARDDRARSSAKSAPARTASRATAKPSVKPARTTVYRGRNHVWIPTLRVDRSVAFFPCSRTRPPDNLVYRWGCSGPNNVYLLGHAHSVFKPLHDAYVSGRLRKGMKVIYADGAGRVRTYRVAWWRVVRPTTDAAWAWAPQPRASMTLQTCVGANSSHRLMVRLVEA